MSDSKGNPPALKMSDSKGKPPALIVPGYLKYIDTLPMSTPDKYKVTTHLGEGGFGKVSLGSLAGDEGTQYAIKSKLRRSRDGITNTERHEVHALKILQNEANVVKLVDIIHEPKKMSLVLSLAKADLFSITREVPHITDGQKRTILHQFFKGLAAIHKHGLIHRDIKTANILVTCDGMIQITDFGSSIPLASREIKKFSSHAGTTCYRPLEMLLGDDSYNEKVDIWAACCTATELWTGQILFPTSDKTHLIKSISELCGFPNALLWPRVTSLRWHRKYENMFGDYTADRVHMYALYLTKNDELAASFLKNMMRLNPDERLSASAALEHQYFTHAPIGADIRDLLRDLK